MTNDILNSLKDIEAREEHLNSLITKRDHLITELQTANSTLPALIAKNKQAIKFKRNNEDYLKTFGSEIDYIEKEQEAIIRNLRTINKEKVEELYLSQHYQDLKKTTKLTKEEVINLIYDEIIQEKLNEVEFVS
jgi:hypothetical protein